MILYLVRFDYSSTRVRMNECRGESLTRMRGPMSHVTRSIFGMSLVVAAAIALTASATAQPAAPAPATPAKPNPPKPAAPNPPAGAAKAEAEPGAGRCGARSAGRARRRRRAADPARHLRRLGRLYGVAGRQEGLLRARQAGQFANDPARPPARSRVSVRVVASGRKGQGRGLADHRLRLQAQFGCDA